MNHDNRNQEIIDQENENKKLEIENKILNQELGKVQSNLDFVYSMKYDHRTLRIVLQVQKYKKKVASELKFCVFEKEQVLEITGLILESGEEKNQFDYYLFSQRIALPRAVQGQPKVTQLDDVIEIIFDQKVN